MSLSKKDPSLRVAANDPHLVSLGGGRLSTAVTIHNIPVGDCTIGSSPQCSVSLSGAGVRPIHCTIYRSEDNQVTLVPERNARIQIDNQLIKNEVDLRQGAMITVGDSYYLRYNNPAEALQMRSAMGDICENAVDFFYESNINPVSTSYRSDKSTYSDYDNLEKSDTYVDFMGWECPKVFTADLVTVNMPAKDVLGQKYASFAKNLVENHRKDKNINMLSANDHIYSKSLNNSLPKSKEKHDKVKNTLTPQKTNDFQCHDKDPLEDMLKICAEYSDWQDRSYTNSSNSNTSSPIVQNRIKTNGSLPRDKKSPFYQELQRSFQGSNSSLSQSPKSKQKSSSGYENVQLLQQNRVETNKNTGYENFKLVPQSPRTKIRTTCLSPKKESNSFNSIFSQDIVTNVEKPSTKYEELIKMFEEKFQKEIETIEASSRSVSNTKKSLSNNSSPATAKRSTKNINNLTIDIKSFISPFTSPQPLKKPTPAPRKINKEKSLGTGSLSNLLANETPIDEHKEREDLLQRIQSLKTELSLLQKQDNETLIEMDMENALVMAELQSLTAKEQKLQEGFKLLQQKIHRLEAQRNATRVMEENQQSKLKHSIEMKQDQVQKLKGLLKQKPENLCLKEELVHLRESLENDKKSFEDLEFQYLEGESEWQAYREDLSLEELAITKQIEECQLSIENLRKQELNSSNTTNEKQRRLSNHLITLITELQECEEQFQCLERKIVLKISSNSSLLEKEVTQTPSNNDISSQGKIIQSLFGSTEMLCPKTHNEDLMSKSVNENMFFNNKIEVSNNVLDKKTNDSNNHTNTKNYNNKLCDTVKEFEEHDQLLTAQRGLRELDCEKQKIEELLRKLNTELKQKIVTTTTNRREETTIENKYLKVNSEKPLFQKEICKSPAYLSSSPPLSATSSEPSNKLSPRIVHKSTNELSISSPDSPRSFYRDEKRSSSVLSNELSSQGDNSSIFSERKKSQQQNRQRPLTRYLPILAEDLDLKRHIETAGHPLSLCPHVILDAYSCRGYLQKLGSTFHTWSKRWFVLDRQRSALIYYANKSERKPRGGSYFSSIDEVYMDHLNVAKNSRTHTTFIVKTKKRYYYLQAASDTAARIWIDAIITGAQGNIDY